MIFDLEIPGIKFTNDLQKNLLLINKKFGESFMIVSNNIKMPAKFYEVVHEPNTDFRYYSIVSDVKERYTYLYPFKIDFLDYETFTKTNNCYIANIQKTKDISGTQMVEFVLKFLKILKAQKVRLHDGTKIQCKDQEIDLSFFKLIEKGITFYQKFGFKLIPREEFAKNKYGNLSKMNEYLIQLLKKFRKIKIDYFIEAYQQILNIVLLVVKNQDSQNLKIYIYHYDQPYLLEKDNHKKILWMVEEINSIFH